MVLHQSNARRLAEQTEIPLKDSTSEFSLSRFIEHIKSTAALLDADFSEPVTRQVLDLYERQ